VNGRDECDSRKEESYVCRFERFRGVLKTLEKLSSHNRTFEVSEKGQIWTLKA
jgi:hypothetical protein